MIWTHSGFDIHLIGVCLAHARQQNISTIIWLIQTATSLAEFGHFIKKAIE